MRSEISGPRERERGEGSIGTFLRRTMERILDGGIIRFFEAGKAEGRSRPDPLSRGALRLYLRKWFSCLKSRSQKWSSHLGMFAKTKKREDCIPQSVVHRAKRTHFDTFRKQSLQKIKKCSPCSSYFFLLLPPKFCRGRAKAFLQVKRRTIFKLR